MIANAKNTSLRSQKSKIETDIQNYMNEQLNKKRKSVINFSKYSRINGQRKNQELLSTLDFRSQNNDQLEYEQEEEEAPSS